MSRMISLAGLMIDSWRDRSPQTEPGEMNLPDGEIHNSRLRGGSDDDPSMSSLANPIALGIMNWEKG